MDEIYTKYKPFLNRLAKKYCSPAADIDDLTQTAYIGLHQAAETYNEEKGASFMNYLAICVNRAILRELDNSMLVRLPSYLHGDIERYKAAKQQTTALSLDMPVGDDDSLSLADTVAGSDYEEMQESVEQRELKRLLWDLLSDTLNNDQYNVMTDYYKLGQTITAIAKRRGFTDSQARSLKDKALRKLRHNHRIKQLGIDYGYVGCYRHIGLNTFKSTWTSTVEQSILDRERYTETLLQEIHGYQTLDSVN